MNLFYSRFTFLLELFFNGLFIIFYSLQTKENMPDLINAKTLKDLVQIFGGLVPGVLLLGAGINFLRFNKNIERFIRTNIFTLIVAVPLVLTYGDHEFAYWLCIVHLFFSTLTVIDGDTTKVQKRSVSKMTFLDKMNLKPAQMVLLTFLLIVMFGCFLLVLPISAAQGVKITFIDALFTATSATCVTGLTTLSIIDNFSIFGQIVILILVQVGGLGIMTLYSSLTILLGKSIAVRQQVVLQDLLDISSLSDLLSMIIDIIKFTLIIELWGAIILTIGFYYEGFEFGQALYYGFFHSISAFCNAGFALFNNSLENFSFNPLIHGTISVLVILGGLGFIVLKEIKKAILLKKSFFDLSVHTRIVIITNIALLTMGTFTIFFSEFLHSLDSFSLWEKLQVSFFQSVTIRTAGFNTISLNSLHSHTLYIMTLFMFIGASPGSTGGGIKTSTFAILIQSVTATLKGRKRVEFFDRRVPNQLVVRATSIIIISLIVVSLFIFLMMKIEADKSFMMIFFEVISAFATVGLSLGITPHLTVMGKGAIIVLMFIGRVGALTLVLAVGERTKSSGSVEYPEGRFLIG
jgi:trk system potassium uptake protein TrkH